MKVIFLDIDGVLNCLRSVLGVGNNTDENFDMVAVGMILDLCIRTDAHIVISSSWRYGDHKALAFELAKKTRRPEFETLTIGETPRGHDGHRGKEIEAWILENVDPEEFFEYVIIDDDDDMLEHQMENFVNTTFMEGFLYSHYVEALKILDPGARPPVYLGARK